MTQMELIERLCAVNSVLIEIVEEQAAIISQHGIEEMQPEDPERHRSGLTARVEEAESETHTIRSQLQVE